MGHPVFGCRTPERRGILKIGLHHEICLMEANIFKKKIKIFGQKNFFDLFLPPKIPKKHPAGNFQVAISNLRAEFFADFFCPNERYDVALQNSEIKSCMQGGSLRGYGRWKGGTKNFFTENFFFKMIVYTRQISWWSPIFKFPLNFGVIRKNRFFCE